MLCFSQQTYSSPIKIASNQEPSHFLPQAFPLSYLLLSLLPARKEQWPTPYAASMEQAFAWLVWVLFVYSHINIW
jgi:hypothetical protein